MSDYISRELALADFEQCNQKKFHLDTPKG